MEDISRRRNPHGHADVYLLGAGISFPEHLTVQAIEILTACRRICTNLRESQLEGLPPDLRDKCVSLWHLYQDDRPRAENYEDVTKAVVEAAGEGLLSDN